MIFRKKYKPQGFAKNLRYLRIKKGLTQRYLSKEIGTSLSNYNGWELNYNKPSFYLLLKLADVLEVSIDKLVEGEEII